jgi:hypothetical protein
MVACTEDGVTDSESTYGRFYRRLTPTPVSGDGPELYDKRGFGPPSLKGCGTKTFTVEIEGEPGGQNSGYLHLYELFERPSMAACKPSKYF